MKVSVIVFPGSNCDLDVKWAFEVCCNADVSMVWHTEKSLPESDVVVLPGGFSYGDYLRSGAMAAKSPIMGSVVEFASSGGWFWAFATDFRYLRKPISFRECSFLTSRPSSYADLVR